VPGQLSIAGFDDTELAAHLQPALTTVTTDVIGWGRAAATRLLELIDERPATELPLAAPRLLVRRSTGPAPKRTTKLEPPSPQPRLAQRRKRLEPR